MRDCFFIANNNIGDSGLSGGDRIFIELARNWKNKFNLSIIGTEEAISVCKRENLTGVNFLLTSGKLNFKNIFTLRAIFINFFKKLFNGVLFVIKNKRLFTSSPVIYSVSDFYPDSLPAFIIKLLNPKVFWIAGFYLFAPCPWAKDSPYKGRHSFRGFLYWLSQRPIYYILNMFADVVYVTSEPDKGKFVKKNKTKAVVIQGGVNIASSTEYLNGYNQISFEQKKYDACFVGRLHQQKGVLCLIDIWNLVVKSKPNAKLAIIGNGPLETLIITKIQDLNLTSNIELLGFLDGEKKFEFFKQSKIILHPATYDSGGMAAAEAMAWGLPGVSFDLEALKTYYPRGMVKISPGNYVKFAQAIIKLLSDKKYYLETSGEARKLIVECWDWDKRSEHIYNETFNDKR